MAWPDKLKIKKGLQLSLTQAGYTEPKEVQLKTLSRINGGQDVIAVGPEGCGKTTAYIIAALNRFTYTADGITRVLVLVPDRERVEMVIGRIEALNNNKTISIVGLYVTPGTEAQMDAMAEGADIVVATPDRARAIYLKLGLNLNKIELLILDDADVIVKQGLQLPVAELANGIVKCQHLVFTEVMHSKLEKMIEPFMKQPAIIEVEESSGQQMELHPQVLYQVPNFGTKLNLLSLLMQDEEVFTKTIVFVSNRPTAEKVYNALHPRLKNAVALYKSWFFEMNSYSSVDEFNNVGEARVLIVADDALTAAELQDVPFLIHFELPDDKEVYLERALKKAADNKEESIFITFATDQELSTVKRIEQASGRKMSVAELPEGLHIQKDKKETEALKAAKAARHKTEEPVIGEAFHEKKASNAKTRNYKATEKAKMNKKKNH